MSFPLDVAAVPDPAGVVALFQGLARDPWPVTESGRDELFERLGLQTAGPRSGQLGYTHGTEQHFALELPLTGAALGTWVMDDHVFRNIYVQLLPGAEPPNPQATACFDEINRNFTELYGEATIPWHGQKGLRRMWDANGLELEVHYGNDNRSSLLIGLSNGMLAALTEAG